MRYLSRRTRLGLFIAVVLPLALPAASARGSVPTAGKGQNLMVNWGLQFNGLIAVTSDPFNLNTLKGANFNSPFWAWTTDVSKLGPAPGSTWDKWFDYTTQNDLTAAEMPYLSNLRFLQVGDEQGLATGSATYTGTVNWINTNRSKFPGAMILTNQYGGEVNDGDLINFTAAANPDALSFDTYPYRVGDTASGGASGNVHNWYGDTQRYRRRNTPAISSHSSYGALPPKSPEGPQPHPDTCGRATQHQTRLTGR